MEKLELIICNDALGTDFHEDLAPLVASTLKPLDVEVNIHRVKEEGLENEALFPENAVVYVHGNRNMGYENVSKVRELAKKRPDLKFMLDIFSFRKVRFSNDQDYDFVIQSGEKGLNASHQVVVLPTQDTLGFFKNPYGKSFYTYVQQLLRPLELMVCYDYMVEDESSRSLVEEIISKQMEASLVGYNLSIVPEETLLNPKDFPENAILYVHGNMGDGYSTVSYVKQLADKRPDLKFILQVDRCSIETDFDDPKNHEFVKEAAARGFDASNQVVISYHFITLFLEGIDNNEEHIKNNFSEYISQLKELKNANNSS